MANIYCYIHVCKELFAVRKFCISTKLRNELNKIIKKTLEYIVDIGFDEKKIKYMYYLVDHDLCDDFFYCQTLDLNPMIHYTQPTPPPPTTTNTHK